MNSRLSVVTCVALAACHPAPTGPRLPSGPLASSLAAWVPSDVAVMIAIGPDGSAAIDDLTTALGWIGPGLLATIDPAITEAWASAAVKPRGAVWMMWDDDARSTATCAIVGNAGRIAAALEAAGGTNEVSAGAHVVAFGDARVVLRDGVACVVESGAPTRTAHHALRLAALTDDDRLLRARPDADALLRALPDADVIVYGQGALIGGLIEVMPGLASVALAGDTPAIALSVAPDTHHATITIASLVAAQEPPREDHGALSPGVLALHPLPERRRDLPLPTRDENEDVPFSDEYVQAERAMADTLAIAVDLRGQLDAVAQAARDAFDRGWGAVAWARRSADKIEIVEATWDPPTWPGAAIRGAAEAAEATARTGEADLRARYDQMVDQVAAKIAARTAIRARDVREWDRSH